VLFPRLASGEISLTVAAVLKPSLAHGNQAEVLAAVAGKTVQQARSHGSAISTARCRDERAQAARATRAVVR
jgi:hypothetical protein